MKNKQKILIVEDEDVLADMYAEQFSHAGWSVAVAHSRDEGLTKAKNEKPDIILLDILLFDGHGFEFLKRKKEDKEISQIPVVVFSNLDDQKTEEEALQFGALEYLLKTNYTPNELVTRVTSWLPN